MAIQAALHLPEYPLLFVVMVLNGNLLNDWPMAPKHIHFLGMLPHSTLQNHIKASTVIAVPSKWPENFPYAVIEAQTYGKPVVASQMGGITSKSQMKRPAYWCLRTIPTPYNQLSLDYLRTQNGPAKSDNGPVSRCKNLCQFDAHLEQAGKNLYTQVIFNRLN